MKNKIYGVAFPQLHALAIADLDGDSLPDLVTGKRKGAHGIGFSDVDSPAVPYWFRLTRPQGHHRLGRPAIEPRLLFPDGIAGKDASGREPGRAE
jgi:hypothetical protein